jgi:hypothetical protein
MPFGRSICIRVCMCACVCPCAIESKVCWWSNHAEIVIFGSWIFVREMYVCVYVCCALHIARDMLIVDLAGNGDSRLGGKW